MGGAPVVMSSPYFYQSPPELRQNLKNFSEPIPSEHETQLDIEPITGMAIKIHKRIQVKFLLLASVTYKKGSLICNFAFQISFKSLNDHRTHFNSISKTNG